MRAIEAEQPRLQLRQADVRVLGAGEPLAEDGVRPFALHVDRGDNQALCEFERNLHRIGQARTDVGLEDDAVDDDVDGVPLGLFELVPAGGRFGGAEVDDLAFARDAFTVENVASALPAVRRAGPGEEHAEVIVDFRRRRDRAARVAAGVPLLNGDGRRQALDVVDLGLLQLVEELPGVGRQRFHVLALAFGKDRVERERRLARPA